VALTLPRVKTWTSHTPIKVGTIRVIKPKQKQEVKKIYLYALKNVKNLKGKTPTKVFYDSINS